MYYYYYYDSRFTHFTPFSRTRAINISNDQTLIILLEEEEELDTECDTLTQNIMTCHSEQMQL